MIGILKKMEEQERLSKLRIKLNPADLQKKNKCVMCGFCCNCRTCIPTPTEAKKIAEFLKLSVKDMINKYYVIDENGTYPHFHIKPLGKNILDLGGKIIPAERTWNEGACVFLDENNKCKIHEVKPHSAKIMRCWEDNKQEAEENKKIINKSWEDKSFLENLGFNLKKLREELEY